ncbi:protein Red [Podospora aff. communis PSN243]|uniref:Protein Red n=1 Tax=Podospora aff. communis PSN243 TaxID=3040156 RepID=A0AAV9GM30_9PEZI|nr:protein Red [Podospora aff. communis PSN243]
MNNEQFRRLLLGNSSKSKSQNGTSPPSSKPSPSLGSKLKSSIPMTPRSVAGASSSSARLDFARQLASQSQSLNPNPPSKKLRTSAPKGSKFAEGYIDRSKTRQEQEEEDERAERLKALEESYKKEEIDAETYDRLRGEIAGGDLGSTHLVKGLDFKLLERVKRGEDVFREGDEKGDEKGEEEEAERREEDADGVLEELEGAEVKAIEKEKTQKKGQFATTGLVPGQKRTRNQILAEMKAARAAAKAKEESSLGSKFKKIGEKKMPGTRIERDGKGREVMIIVDEDGHERRKVRKVDPEAAEEQRREEAALMKDTVLGMEVPEFYKKQLAEQEAAEESKEISIFDDVGSDYDPLADLEGSDSSSEEEGEEKEKRISSPEKTTSADMPPPPRPSAAGPRNWFKDSKTGLTSEETYKAKTLDVKDPSFLAALQKAKKISAAEKSEEEQKAAEREELLKKKLLESNRDDDDLDMGFGSNRMEDDADLEEQKVKLSAWGQEGDEDDDGGKGSDKSKRKRGPKKKKGDKNNFADVMKVIERKKGSG